MMQVSMTIATDGSGFWSSWAKNVKVTGLDLAFTDDSKSYGELRVYFDAKSWNINRHGLIYSDFAFIQKLKARLANMNLGTDVSYSEQGMQGRDYVSLDAGPEFIKSFESAKI